MDGFAWGVEHYNSVHAASVDVLGWDPDSQDGLFSGGFDEASGATMAQGLIDEGADVILPAAGDGRVGAADRCLATAACLVIGVDSDSFPVYYEDVWMASVVKGVDTAVIDTVENIVFGGTVGSRNYRGDLANGGTSLAPFPKYDDVPAWLQSELAALEAAIVAGTVPVG
jgi:basic membrane protein A